MRLEFSDLGPIGPRQDRGDFNEQLLVAFLLVSGFMLIVQFAVIAASMHMTPEEIQFATHVWGY